LCIGVPDGFPKQVPQFNPLPDPLRLVVHADLLSLTPSGGYFVSARTVQCVRCDWTDPRAAVLRQYTRLPFLQKFIDITGRNGRQP
jgi:hypothetical protein